MKKRSTHRKGNRFSKWIHRSLALFTVGLFAVSSSPGAQAIILFQDDDFHEILSPSILIDSDGTGTEDTSIQFGNDPTPANNGIINWDITNDEFDFNNDVNITGGLEASGNVDFSGASEFHIREVTDEATATCTTTNEIVLDTTEERFYICTTPGSPGTWVGSDSGSSQDFEDVYSTDADNTLTASGTFDIDATGALGFDSDAGVTIGGAGVSVTSDGGALSLTGDGTNDVDVTNTGAAIDFDAGSFDVLTTSGISLDAGSASNVTTSAGDLTLEATTGSTNLTGGEAAADAVRINASNAAGGIDIDAGTGGVAVDTTGALSIDSAGTSNITNDSGALSVGTTTSGNLNLTGADDIVFDDGTITGNITLSDTDTDWAATFADDGIVDVINSFTSTATGEGASNIGIEDAGGYFTGTDAEAALQELGASSDLNNDVLTFHPEYPDTVIFQDGTNNNGKLEADYDSTNREQYYQWTTKKNAQHNIDLRFRFELPTDFADAGNLTVDFRTFTTLTADNSVAVTVRNDTDDTTCHADGAQASSVADTWETITITGAEIDTGCTAGALLAAGDVVEIIIKFTVDNTNTGAASTGEITFAYTN